MSFLLDTDICSAYLKGDRRLYGRFMQHTGQLHTSVVSVGELFTGALRASAPPSRMQNVLDFLDDLTVLDADTNVGYCFGQTRARELDTGVLTPKLDLLIASTALAHNLTLVTHNTRDFANVPGLRVQDWLVP